MDRQKETERSNKLKLRHAHGRWREKMKNEKRSTTWEKESHTYINISAVSQTSHQSYHVCLQGENLKSNGSCKGGRDS